MARVTFWFKDSDKYVSVEAEEFHEDDGYLKAYQHNELVAMFDVSITKGAYRTEEKEGNNRERG